MSRGDQNLDELFKHALQPQEHEVVPAYWQEAQQMIHASKAAKTPFYFKPFFIAGAILATATISAVLFFGSTPEKQLAGNPTVDNPQKSTLVFAAESNSGYSTANPPTTLTKNNPLPQNEANVAQNPKNENKKSIANNSGLEKEIATSNSNTRNSFAKKWETTSFSNTQNKQQPKAVKTNAVSEEITESAINKPINLQASVTIPVSFTSNSEVFSAPVVKEERSVQSLLRLPSKSWSDLSSEKRFTAPQGLKESTHKKLWNPFNLRLSAGALWEGQNSSTNSWVTSNSQEQNIEFSVEYLFHKRWGVQTGITWNQQKNTQSYRYLEEIDNSYWTQEEYVSTVINRVWWLGDWYYYPNTYDTTYEDVYVFLKDSVAQTNTLKNKVTIIEIPLLLTYNYAWNCLNVQLATGISLGTVVNASGAYFQSKDPFAQEISSAGFSGVQSSFLFRSELGYGINENWWLTARPQIKWNLNSIAPNNATISPKVFYYGVNAGLMYRF